MRHLRSALVAPLLAAGLCLPAIALAADHAPVERGPSTPAPAPAKSARVGQGDVAAAAVTTATAAPMTDPLEQLRQRLAERLGGGRGGDAGGARELRVVAKSAAAAGHGAAASSRKAAAAGHKGAAASAPWDYGGAAGPQAWAGLKPEFALCGSGQRQSPIDIRDGLAVDLEPVHFEYQASRFAVLDNGRTVQVNVAPGNAIEVGGRRFELQQFHFHRPSEERIDGRQFEMSVHLVHKDDQGRLAVVTVLLDQGPAQPVVQKVWNNLPLERDQESAARVPLELADLLPSDRRYYTYMGSLTTPPCSEGVQWIVMRTPVTVTPEQIEIFARIYPMNARPLQAAAGRRIMQSN